MIRKNRKNIEFRQLEIVKNYIKNADGSCLIKLGNTHIICTASFEYKVPRWLKGSGKGWITAEYGMIPRSTTERMRREVTVGKVSGRTSEIQRLIGRSLRSAIDLNILGEYLVTIDCDVIQADGGTRTAAITGGYVALAECIKIMQEKKIINTKPIKNYVAAISCGYVKGDFLLDLEYEEDYIADVDANFVINSNQELIEIQLTSEKEACSEEEFNFMLIKAKEAIKKIIDYQKIKISE